MFNAAMAIAKRAQNRRRRKGKKIRARDLRTVSYRTGGLGGGMPPVKTSPMAIAPNTGYQVQGLQTAKPVRISGSEVVSTIIVPTAYGDGQFYLMETDIINPAEPALPRLAATANQFQRFKTVGINYLFTPSAPTDTSGTIYFGMAPNADSAAPTDVSGMISLLDARSSPLFGVPVKWSVNPTTYQQAYKVQQIDCPANPNESAPTSIVGKLFIGVSGVNTLTDPVTVGTLTTTYEYELSVPKLTHGSNSLHGTYIGSDFTTGDDVLFTVDDLSAGWHTLLETATAGVYKLRVPGAPHMIAAKGTATTGPFSMVVEAGRTEQGTFSAVTGQIYSASTDFAGYWHIPAGQKYVKLAWNASRTPTAFSLLATSLRST